MSCVNSRSVPFRVPHPGSSSVPDKRWGIPPSRTRGPTQPLRDRIWSLLPSTQSTSASERIRGSGKFQLPPLLRKNYVATRAVWLLYSLCRRSMSYCWALHVQWGSLLVQNAPSLHIAMPPRPFPPSRLPLSPLSTPLPLPRPPSLRRELFSVCALAPCTVPRTKKGRTASRSQTSLRDQALEAAPHEPRGSSLPSLLWLCSQQQVAVQ